MPKLQKKDQRHYIWVRSDFNLAIIHFKNYLKIHLIRLAAQTSDCLKCLTMLISSGARINETQYVSIEILKKIEHL